MTLLKMNALLMFPLIISVGRSIDEVGDIVKRGEGMGGPQSEQTVANCVGGLLLLYASVREGRTNAITATGLSPNQPAVSQKKGKLPKAPNRLLVVLLLFPVFSGKCGTYEATFIVYSAHWRRRKNKTSGKEKGVC